MDLKLEISSWTQRQVGHNVAALQGNATWRAEAALRVIATLRHNATITVAVLAKILLRSPGKLFISIIKKYVDRIKESNNSNNKKWKKNHWFTIQANPTLRVNATSRVNATWQINVVLQVNVTVQVNVTLQLNATLQVSVTFRVNAALQVNCTLRVVATLKVNDTFTSSCFLTR